MGIKRLKGKLDKVIFASPEDRRKALDSKKIVQDIKEGKATHLASITGLLKTTPYGYQRRAFGVGITLDQAALLMEQGTGKTLSAMAIALYRASQGQIRKLLIIPPLSVASIWVEEFQKHSNYNCQIADLTDLNDKKRITLLNYMESDLQIAIINYESIRLFFEELMWWSPQMIILDESQKIKNRQAKRSKLLFKLGDQTRYKLILTGTPMADGPLDFWSQYRFLNPDIFGRNYRKFQDEYAIMGGYGGYEIKGYKNLEELSEKVNSIAFRITKDEAGISTPAVDQKIIIPILDKVRALYKNMEKDFLIKFGHPDRITKAPIILTQLLRLQQITGGFVPTENEGGEKQLLALDSAKLKSLKELLEDLPRHKKLVIVARFIPELLAIESLARKMGRFPVVMRGGVKPGERKKLREQFQDEQSQVDTFVAQIQTGGLGITLTAADTVIFYSTTFSYIDYEQSRSRIDRIGQRSNSITYINLVTKDTIDEDILETLKSKGDMAMLVLDKMRKRLKMGE